MSQFGEIAEMLCWMDGGSVTFKIESPNGETVQVDIVQHVIHDYYPDLSLIPGRVYLNEQLIDKRSAKEEAIINFLSNNPKGNLQAIDRRIICELVDFVRSDKYMTMEPKILDREERLRQTGRRRPPEKIRPAK